MIAETLAERRERRAADKVAAAERWSKVMSENAPPRPRADGKPPVRFERTSGWGDSLGFHKFKSGSETQRVYGFRPRNYQPVVGDHFHTEHPSGRTGLWVFTEVEPCWDPDDMFFATVRWWGYLDELDPPPEYGTNAGRLL